MSSMRRPAFARRFPVRTVASLALVFSLFTSHASLQQGGAADRWVGTWATAVVERGVAAQAPPAQAPPAPQGQTAPAAVPPAPAPPPPILAFSNQTLRQIVRTSIGGTRVRVVLSNAFGTAPLVVGAAEVALRDKEAAIAPQSARALSFSGRPNATVAPGAVIFSDPVNLTVPALAHLAIDLYLPDDIAAAKSPFTVHAGALQTNYVSAAGNHVGAANFPVMTTTPSWHFLSRVEVAAPARARAVVALGDSITDGSRSTPDTDNRWPDHFAKRLKAQNIAMGVMNSGIAGNRVLSNGAGVSALARFDRDVLALTGVTHVVVIEGINDLGQARGNSRPTAADLIAGHRQIIARAHARGLKIIGGTVLPCEGTTFQNYFSPENEAVRKALNEWMLTSKEYDAVVDFDALMRDPGRPTQLLPKYASPDKLHPNDAGYEAMANAIDLGLFAEGRARK